MGERGSPAKIKTKLATRARRLSRPFSAVFAVHGFVDASESAPVSHFVPTSRSAYRDQIRSQPATLTFDHVAQAGN
jgi:hypothetical protein